MASKQEETNQVSMLRAQGLNKRAIRRMKSKPANEEPGCSSPDTVPRAPRTS